MNICPKIMKTIKKKPKLLKNIIIYGESWFFTCNPVTKDQLMDWRTLYSQILKKAQKSNSEHDDCVF